MRTANTNTVSPAHDLGLGGLVWVTLHLAPAKAFPMGSKTHGYHLLMPLDKEGWADPLAWKRQRHGCPVLRFWAGEPTLIGSLRHRAGGIGGSAWIIDYHPGVMDDEAGCRLGVQRMLVGESLTLMRSSGTQTFRIAGISSRMPARVRRHLLTETQALPAGRDREFEAHRERPAPPPAGSGGRRFG